MSCPASRYPVHGAVLRVACPRSCPTSILSNEQPSPISCHASILSPWSPASILSTELFCPASMLSKKLSNKYPKKWIPTSIASVSYPVSNDLFYKYPINGAVLRLRVSYSISGPASILSNELFHKYPMRWTSYKYRMCILSNELYCEYPFQSSVADPECFIPDPALNFPSSGSNPYYFRIFENYKKT